jgi:hypothetical protein
MLGIYIDNCKLALSKSKKFLSFMAELGKSPTSQLSRLASAINVRIAFVAQLMIYAFAQKRRREYKWSDVLSEY